MSGWKRIGRAADFSREGARSVRLGEQRVAVFRIGGEWFALEDVCPHMRARLSEGRVRKGVVTCSWHGWRFDLRTGRCLGRGRRNVRTCRVRERDGDVWLGPLGPAAPPDGTSGGGP
ncbi:MAG: Rieske (2Fe-2S) protein [Acidobacteriota bacterium]